MSRPISHNPYSARLTRRRLLAHAGVATVGLAAATACAGNPAPPSSAAASPVTAAGGTPASAAPADTPTAPPKAKYGGTLRYSVGSGEYPHYDVHISNSYYLIAAGPGVAYSQLLRFRSGPGVPQPNYTPAPDAATGWDQPDETTYVFKLRPGIKYHNLPPVNGRELVADDVVKSFERQVAEKANAGLLAGVQKTEAVDKYTLRMQLAAPAADFLWGIASANCKIVPPESWGVRGDLKEGPIIGSGPFVFESAEKGSLVTLTRNPDYFEKGLPYVDRLQLFRIADSQTLLSAFRAKNLDFGGTGFTLGDIEGLKKQAPELVSFTTVGPGGASFFMGLKSDRPPFNDPRVRQAVSKGINRDEVIKTVFGGGARIAPGVTLPAADWELPEAELKRLLAYEPDRARQLMKDAGLEGGITVDCPVGNYAAGLVIQAAELIAAQLKPIGVTLNLRPLEGVVINDVIYNRGQYEGAFISLHAGATTTSSFLFNVYHSKGPQRTTGWSDPQLDDMIDRQAVMAKDVEGRKKLVMDIERRIIDNATYIPVLAIASGWVGYPYVRDLYPNLLDPTSTFSAIWLDK
jgi:peptide/nickel transport system substrate-binding protein